MKSISNFILFAIFSLAFLPALAQVKPKAKPQPKDISPTFVCFPENPQFPGGYKAMNSFLLKHILYPKTSKKSDGQTIFQFVITKTGEIEKIQIVKSSDPAFDRAAAKAITEMPNWIPATENGKPIDFLYTLPIKFIADSPGRSKEKNKK